MKDTMEFLDEIKQDCRAHSAFLHHPFMKRLEAGQATLDEIRGWAQQFWVIPQTHLINNAGKLAHSQLLRGGWLDQLVGSGYQREIVDMLGDAVMDELGHTEISPENHYDCFFNLTDALGLPREQIGRPETLLPQSLVAMHTWASSALNFSLLELVASHNLVNDSVNIIAYPRFCQALTTHYGLSQEAVRWFDLHGEVDKEHNSMSTQVLKLLIRNDEDQARVRVAAKLGLGVKWSIFDAVWHAYVDGSYTV